MTYQLNKLDVDALIEYLDNKKAIKNNIYESTAY